MFSIYVFMVPNLLEHFFDLPFFSFSVKRVHEACHADLKFCKLCQTLFSPNQWKFMSFLYFHFRIFTENVAAWLQRSRNGAFLLHTDFFFPFSSVFLRHIGSYPLVRLFLYHLPLCTLQLLPILWRKKKQFSQLINSSY